MRVKLISDMDIYISAKWIFSEVDIKISVKLIFKYLVKWIFQYLVKLIFKYLGDIQISAPIRYINIIKTKTVS